MDIKMFPSVNNLDLGTAGTTSVCASGLSLRFLEAGLSGKVAGQKSSKSSCSCYIPDFLTESSRLILL